MISSVVDLLGYGFTMVVFMGLPAAGLVVNVAGMQRRGLNRYAGLAACLFFLTLLVQGTTVTLSSRYAITDTAEFWLIAATAAANVVSSLLALFALWQIRRKHRWPRGRKRAVAVFFLNIASLIAIAGAFFLRVNPAIEKRIFG